MIQRDDLRFALARALASRDDVLAVWEGGAAAFDRADEWSDIDLQAVVHDDAVAATFATVEQALRELSPIEIIYEIPQPSWHGHAQKFYRLRDAGPFLLVDFVVMQQSASNRFLEPEIHGNAVVHFDRAGITSRTSPLDREVFARQLWKRVNDMRLTFPLFQSMTLKELHRGNAIDALSFYNAFTLAPLVELLRILHGPFHYNFRSRYLYHELPPGVVSRLEKLYFISGPDDLHARQQEAEEWFYSVLDTLTPEKLLEQVQR